MTLGIFVAVFVVRFALPIFIVELTTNLSFLEVVKLALNDPLTYAHELHKAGPLIDAFGGTFLVMLGVAYFFDAEKDVHWFAWLERRLAPLGRYDNLTIFVMVLGALVMFFTVPEEAAVRATVIVAAVCGIALHLGLDLFGAIVDGDEDEEEETDEANGDAQSADDTVEIPVARPATNGTKGKTKVLVGLAALVMIIRLEILDASFSFDGVIGAFAITTSVLIIMAGLGAGAVWVRAMTVHLLRAGTLAKYKFLEHGAMWAILFLGLTMIAKLYHIEPPEWATGSIGLVFIGLAVITSVFSDRRIAREEVRSETATIAA
jgi:hypothetical protein